MRTVGKNFHVNAFRAGKYPVRGVDVFHYQGDVFIGTEAEWEQW